MRSYYKPANYSMKNSVGYLMRLCINRLLPRMEALFEERELTFTQWTTLAALHDGRITTASDLAYNICHDAGSLTRVVDQMVERGYVTRSRDQADRRVVRLSLTPPGRRLVEALAPRVIELWNGLLSGFTHAEVDTLIALLTRLVIVAEGKPRGARAPKLVISDQPIAQSARKSPVTNAKRRTS